MVYLQLQLFIIRHLLPIDAAKALINSSDYFVNFQLLKFTLSCLDLSGNLLTTQGVVAYVIIVMFVCFCNIVFFFIVMQIKLVVVVGITL